MLEADEDLSYASMFASALGHDITHEEEQHTKPSPLSLDIRDLPQPSTASKPKLGSIALGGLLTASTPTGSLFGGLPSTSGASSFLGTPSSMTSPLGLPYPQAPRPLDAPSPLQPPKALTPQELEAQLRAGAPQQQQHQQQYQMAPQQLHHQFMGSQMGQPGSLQQSFSGEMPSPGHMQMQMHMPPGFPGMLPPPGYGPPPPYMQGPPPPGPPGFGPPQMLNHRQPGVFTPDMIMQAQQSQQQGGHLQQRPPPPGMPPYPDGPPPPQHRPLPPGGVAPLGPAPPGYMPPALGAGPPRGPPGFQQQRGPPPQGPPGPGGHPHANLAQRLRALNIADRPDAYRGPSLRRRYASQCMAQEEIESILHMQWRPLHQGAPYIEDYYYQAFVYKFYGKRNRRSFAPESVRELAPTEKVAPDEVAFVKLEGLGRVPFSNVRRPRPLMDVSAEDLRAAAAAAEGETDAEPAVPSRRLDQEPMLAARIMIEDCMALILDVQDIDRIFTAAAASREPLENAAALRQRRTLLMDGLTASLRLPEEPVIDTTASKGEHAASDGVFLRLLALPKGKNLAARVLLQLYPTAEAAASQEGDAAAHPNLRILWALLRNVRAVFGEDHAVASSGNKSGATAAVDNQTASSKVASAAAGVVKGLHSRAAVCEALAALIHGDLDAIMNGSSDPEAVLLPLFAPGIESAAQHHFPWLVDILTALLQRAAEFELSTASPAGGEESTNKDEAEVWKKDFNLLYDAVLRHIEALAEAVAAAAAEGDVEGAAEVKRLIPVELGRSLLQHCSEEQAGRVKTALTSIGA